jgi:chromosome segregation ATPase
MMDGMEQINNFGGIAGLLSLAGLILWQVWTRLSPMISEQRNNIQEAQGAVHSDLVSRIDSIRQSEREAQERIDELEAQLDVERGLRRHAEDEAAQERIERRKWETKHRRAVDELISLGRDDLAAAIDSLSSGAKLVEDSPPSG